MKAMGAMSKGSITTQKARGGKSPAVWQRKNLKQLKVLFMLISNFQRMVTTAYTTCRLRLLGDQQADLAQVSLRSLVEKGKRGYLLALVCSCFADSAHSGVVARIEPQSIVVCPGKRVTWKCIAEADCDGCPEPQRIIMIAPVDGPIDNPGDGNDPSPVPPPQKPGDPPPEDPTDPPYPYPPQPPRPPDPPGDPGKPWPPGYPPGDPPGDCENPPEVTRLTYTWKIERQEGERWVTERGPEEGGPEWPVDGFLFTESHAGKRFRISCTVKAYARLADGTEAVCAEATAYAFARVKRPDELAVSLEADPEPVGVWQTVTLTATVDMECDGENRPTPPFTYKWTFGDDPNKVIERQRDAVSDTVHYFYKQLYRYLVRVEVTDSEGRRGSASMWVHVGLAVRLGSPMSMYVPLREYIREGENMGLADPSWTPEQIQPCEYLHAGARYPAQIVCVAVKGQTLPYEYTHQRTQRQIQYPRVDPIWGTIELLPVLQMAGFSIKGGQTMVQEHGGGWRNGWVPKGVWWVPDNTYLWPLNAMVRSTNTRAYWWNYWTDNAYALDQKGLRVVRTTVKLGWMESWDLAAITVVEAEVAGGSQNARLNSRLTWTILNNPCTGRPATLLMGGVPPATNEDGSESPAFLMYRDIRISHPWFAVGDSGACRAGDTWQRQAALNHRSHIQIGAVQSVEKFSEGYFSYTSGRRLHYFLQEPPPLLDTFSCPTDTIQHAWYAERGRPMILDEQRMQRLANLSLRYQSYQTLSDSREEGGWLVRIGWLDYPGFGVPPTDNFYVIASSQSWTPALKFYTAIAARTTFFPFSYVPIAQTSGWQISFNGTANYNPLTGQMEYESASGSGASPYAPELGQPETGYICYNSKITGQWR